MKTTKEKPVKKEEPFPMWTLCLVAAGTITMQSVNWAREQKAKDV